MDALVTHDSAPFVVGRELTLDMRDGGEDALGALLDVSCCAGAHTSSSGPLLMLGVGLNGEPCDNVYVEGLCFTVQGIETSSIFSVLFRTGLA